MEIRVHFPPLAEELSILCEEDPGLFHILFTRVKFTAASLPVHITFFFLLFLPPSLFAHGAVVKMSYLAVGSSVSRGAFGVILLWQWMDKRRRVTVRCRYFSRLIFIPWTHQSQTHYLLSCLLFQPQLQCSWPRPVYTFILYTIFPLCPAVHYAPHSKTCTNTILYCSILYFSSVVGSLNIVLKSDKLTLVLQSDIVNKALTCPRDGI